MKVSPSEAMLIDYLLQGWNAADIQKFMILPQASYYDAIRKLIQLHILIKVRPGRYELTEPYEIIKNHEELMKFRHALKYVTFPIHPAFKIAVTQDMKRRIASHYEQSNAGLISRRVLAKELGLPRYLINMTVIELGLEQKPRSELEFEQDYEWNESGCFCEALQGM